MTYTNYEYYSGTYKGGLTSDLFDKYVLKASREIDKNVNKKITETDITDNVQYVTCELIDAIYKRDDNTEIDSNGKIVTSIDIDGVKKSYQTTSYEERITSYNAEKQAILNGLPHELTRYL